MVNTWDMASFFDKNTKLIFCDFGTKYVTILRFSNDLSIYTNVEIVELSTFSIVDMSICQNIYLAKCRIAELHDELCWIFELSLCQSVKMLECRIVEELKCPIVEMSCYHYVNLSKFCSVELLKGWNVELSKSWSVEMSKSWSVELSNCRRVEMSI